MSLDQYHAPLDALIQSLSPARQQKLARQIAVALRRSQADRIRAQKNPDGRAFAPRSKKSRRKGKMFKDLVRVRHLKALARGGLGYVNMNNPFNVAEKHQFGLKATIRPNLRVKMPVRELMGFSRDDREMITEIIYQHITEGFHD